jgi:iron complex transport system ATP-binding protein
MSGAALRVGGLSVRYRDRSALRDVTVGAEAGEIVALAGPNGAGKSTLLRAVAGLESPLQGSIVVGGTDLGELSLRARARQVGWMPQEEPRGDNLPVEEYVRYGRFPHVPPLAPESAADASAVERALRLAGADDLRGRSLWELSGGERQRVRLARVLAQGTPLLLLDEPTAHLDVGHQLDVLERVRGIARVDRITVVLAVHDLNLAARFADRIVVLHRGRVVADGRPREVLSPQLLLEVWGVVSELRYDARSQLPYLIPRAAASEVPLPHPTTTPLPRVHVMAGGGSGADILRGLVDAGFAVSAGALPLFDSDTEVAQELGVPSALEVPFAPVSEATRARLRGFLAESAYVVVAPFPVGPANLANLEELQGREPAESIFFLGQPAGRSWDFTGGVAAGLRAELLRRGAREVRGLDGLLEAIAGGRPR